MPRMPHVAVIVPDQGAPGTVVEASVLGTDLDDAAGLAVSGRGVEVTVIGRPSAQWMRVSVAIAADAAAGPRAMVALGAQGDGGAAVLFHVRAPGSHGGMMGIGAQLI